MPLRRNQKIGIAAAGGATAIGLTAALLYAARRTPRCAPGTTYIASLGRCEPLVGTDSPGTTPGATDGSREAKRRFCSYPKGLTLGQRELLESTVFAPLVLEAGGLDWSGPQQVDAGIAAAATAAVSELCNRGITRPRTRTLALELARSAWWSLTGQTGQ